MILFDVLGKWDPKNENIYILSTTHIFGRLVCLKYNVLVGTEASRGLKTMGGDLLISILHQMQTTEDLLVNLQDQSTIYPLIYCVSSKFW